MNHFASQNQSTLPPILFFRHSSSGAAMFTLIMTLPLILSTLWLCLGHYQAIRFHQKVTTECRQQSEQIQEKLRLNLKKILQLNSLLLYFAEQKKYATLLLLSPQTAPIGTKLLKIANLGLKLTAQTQNSLIYVTEIWWNNRLNHFLKKSEFNEIVYKLESRTRHSGFGYRKLPLKRKDFSNPYSPLVPDTNFAQQTQIIKIWSHQTSPPFFAPPPLKPFSATKTVLRGCQSHLEHTGQDIKIIKKIVEPYGSKVYWFF